MNKQGLTKPSVSEQPPTPVIVIGVPRGGANSVRDLLNLNRDVNIGYNLRTFSHGPPLYRRSTGLDKIKNFTRLLDRLIRLEGDSVPRAWLVNVYTTEVDQLFELHRANPSFATLTRSAFKLAKPELKFFGNKCTHPKVCHNMLKLWPDARIISVIRDPRGTAFAFRKHNQRFRIRYSAMHWNMHVDWTNDMLARHNELELIRYEQMISDMGQQLSRLQKILGFDDPQAVARVNRTKSSSCIVSKQWRAQLEQHEQRSIERICFHRMKACRYEPELTSSERLPSTPQRMIEVALQWLAERRSQTQFRKPHLSQGLKPATN